jgi:hypothetical protein
MDGNVVERENHPNPTFNCERCARAHGNRGWRQWNGEHTLGGGCSVLHLDQLGANVLYHEVLDVNAARLPLGEQKRACSNKVEKHSNIMKITSVTWRLEPMGRRGGGLDRHALRVIRRKQEKRLLRPDQPNRKTMAVPRSCPIQDLNIFDSSAFSAASCSLLRRTMVSRSWARAGSTGECCKAVSTLFNAREKELNSRCACARR